MAAAKLHLNYKPLFNARKVNAAEVIQMQPLRKHLLRWLQCGPNKSDNSNQFKIENGVSRKPSRVGTKRITVMTKFLLPTIALTASLLFFGCTNADKSKPATTEQTTSTLTASDKQEIEKEISNLGKSFFTHVEKLNIDSCMNYFENTSDFWSVNPDGTAGDYNSLKKINGEGFSQMKSFSSKLNSEKIRVLSKTQVLYTYFVTQEFVLKTGETMKMENVAGTMLLDKIDNSWKATFYQESGGQPVKVEPTK